MKIQNRGITLDLGYPIASEEDMKDLFVSAFPELEVKCKDWLRDVNNCLPLVIAGQIGMGKTTFITHFFQRNNVQPDIYLSFDKDNFVICSEGFLGYLFFKVIFSLKKLDVDTSKWDGNTSLITTSGKEIQELHSIFMLNKPNAENISKRSKLLGFFGKYEFDFKIQITEMIDTLVEALGHCPLIFCEGIDKYRPSTGDFHLLSPFLSLLSETKSKIMYEVNLLHSIRPDCDWLRKETVSIVLTSINDETIQDILERRLGAYADHKKSVLPLLAALSGGNPRQAIRLLDEYFYAYERLNKSKKDSVHYACDRVRDDFLKSGSVDFNFELLKVIKRDGYFRPTEDSPLYWNWVLAIDVPEHGKVPAKINPLLMPAVDTFKGITIEDSELNKLNEWAKEHDISPFGLTVPADMKYDEFIDQMNTSELWEPRLTITNIFNEMASFFLDRRFNSLYLIFYKELEIAHIASDFICGEAAAQGDKYFGEGVIDKNTKSFSEFESQLKKFDGLSLFFDESLSAKEVEWCEIKRDQLIGKRIILWVRRDSGLQYLNIWPHFRQFVRVLELEKEILHGLSTDDIESDIKQLERAMITKERKKTYNEKLKRVLLSLKRETGQHA